MDWDPETHYKEIEIAERYDRERFSRLTGKAFDILEKYNIARAFKTMSRDTIVLDLPCGTGRLAEVLLKDGFTVEGVDISPAMLEVSKRKLSRFQDRFTTIVADVNEISKTHKKKYDIALCARVLMHFPLDEQIKFLKGVSDLTKGKVVFTQSLSTPYQRMRRKLKRLIGNPPSAAYPIDENELKELLVKSGLKEVRRQRPFPLISEEIIITAEHI